MHNHKLQVLTTWYEHSGFFNSICAKHCHTIDTGCAARLQEQSPFVRKQSLSGFSQQTALRRLDQPSHTEALLDTLEMWACLCLRLTGFSLSIGQLLVLFLVLLQHTPCHFCMSTPVIAVHVLVTTLLRVSI